MGRDDLITQVLMPIAEELNLPIAFKFGAMRAVNPSLRTGQDAVEVADVGSLRRLCTDFPRVRIRSITSMPALIEISGCPTSRSIDTIARLLTL